MGVKGQSYFSDNATFAKDIAVNGGGAGSSNTADITTTITSGAFNLAMDTGFVGLTSGTRPTNGLKIGGSVRNIEIGNVSTASQNIKIANTSTDAEISIGESADGSNANKSKTTIGGAFASTESDSFVNIAAKSFKMDGDAVLGLRRGLTDTTKLESPSGTVEFFSGNSATSILKFAENASEVTIAGQGGTTKVRNNLIVDGTSRFNSDMTLCGGYASYSFVGLRASAGTAIESHTSGILGNNLFNKNVDLITVYAAASSVGDGTYNAVDTAGTGNWGGSTFQTEPAGTGWGTLTGDQYYLPLKRKPVDAQGSLYYSEGDILLIDSVETGTGHAEFVKIVTGGLKSVNTAPYWIVVERKPFFTGQTTKDNHLDTTAIFKCNVQYDSTWITANIDDTGTEDNVYLATFGGSLSGKTQRQTSGDPAFVSATAPGDYVIISRRDTSTPADGIFDDGEIFELKSALTQVAKSFKVKNGCDTSNPITVFEINSVTGDVTINNNSTTVNGTLNLIGACGGTAGIYPSPDPTTDDHFTLKNGLGVVYDVNLCNGDTLVGSTQGQVFAISDAWGSASYAHPITSVVQTYRYDKWTLQSDGPITTASAAFTNNDTQIPIAGNNAAFSVGDLIMIQNGNTEMEIVQLTSAATQTSGQWYLNCASNSAYPGGGRGSEGTAVKNQWASGVQIRKIKKYVNTTTLSEVIDRTQVPSPNTDPNKIIVKLMNSDLIADKLDTDHFFKITTGANIEWFQADSIDGTTASDGTKYAKSVVTSTNPDGTVNRTKFFGGGALTVHDDFELYSGNFRMYGSDGQTLLFNVANDDNHPADPASIDEKTGTNGIFFNGQMKLRGDLFITEESCESNGTCSLATNFKVESSTGDLSVGAVPSIQTPLYIKGRIDQSDTGSSSQPVLHVDNLGGAGANGTVGPKDFLIYQDGSIDAFGINRYWTRNGGRRYTYVEQSATGIGQTQANPLQPNNNYLLNNPTGTNMVVYLPATAETGDVIRFVEVAGTATYNTSIVIRALKVNNLAVAVQGDTSGSKIQAGAGQLTTAWDSGEMIVQTRNASFGLIYVGATDAAGDPNASSIPNNLRGWWLAEL